MQILLYAIVLVLLAGFSVLFYFLIDLKKKSERPAEDATMKVMMEWMKDIKESAEKTRSTMDLRIQETNKTINERLDGAARVIGALSKELGQMSQIGPDIRRLAETLASPKLRGNFGEEMLENMLGDILPKSGFAIQHRFKNGETVDACIMIGNSFLPVDSKFSLENFRLYKEAQTDEAAESLRKSFLKDVKKRVDEIAKKYILPQEGTFDFALMYVPSEGIYQEIIMAGEIVDYCRSKSVIPVSPNTMFIYLRNIVLSMRGQEVNQKAQEILKMIGGIKQESDKFSRTLEVLGNHIKNAGNTMGSVNNDFSKLKLSISNAATLQLEAKPDRELETQPLLQQP